MEIAEGSLVLCTVKKIEKTTIFLEIEGNGEGSMHLSEVAAGRIRNLRDYVFPNKKIVCKVLAIEPGNIQLSLRRVTAKERESVLEHSKKEKRFISMLKVVLPNPEELIRKIRENHDLVDFLEEAHDSPAILEKFFTKNESEKLIKIFCPYNFVTLKCRRREVFHLIYQFIQIRFTCVLLGCLLERTKNIK